MGERLGREKGARAHDGGPDAFAKTLAAPFVATSRAAALKFIETQSLSTLSTEPSKAAGGLIPFHAFTSSQTRHKIMRLASERQRPVSHSRCRLSAITLALSGRAAQGFLGIQRHPVSPGLA